jgi:Sulfotransferase family
MPSHETPVSAPPRLAASITSQARRRPDNPGGPVIVLTYAHAGSEFLTGLLSASPSLTCTSATGLLPACHAAALAWHAIEGRQEKLSRLAIKSIGVLATTMMAALPAGARTRWCETAFAAPAAAATFLQAFPSTRVICLHRRLHEVFSEGTATYPWGLGDSPFGPFAASYPGSNVAAVAAYWVAHTGPLLEFEARHPKHCIRIRYEDLTDETNLVTNAICEFLGLDADDISALQAPSIPLIRENDNTGFAEQLNQLPDTLLANIRKLHDTLGY